VHCPNELPPTLSAYKTQQYRWNSGPMVVVKQMISSIWSAKSVWFMDRISCTYFFFRCGLWQWWQACWACFVHRGSLTPLA
jgi:hypothetical protein